MHFRGLAHSGASHPATSHLADGEPRPTRVGARSRATLGALLSLALAFGGLAAISPATAAEPDLAPLGSITASASQNDADGNFPAENAIDGNRATRWASGNGPDADTTFTASLTSDLGSVATVSGVSLVWEAAFAARYDVQVATADPATESSWTTVHSVTNGAGATEEVAFASPVQARYVRIAMLERTAFTPDTVPHWYGYSLFTLAVHGAFATPTVGFAAATATVGAGGDATIGVNLSGASQTEQSVRVTSGGGTAAPTTDYTAVDRVLTFAPGVTTATVTVPTVTHGPLAPLSTFTLTLSDASSGIAFGTRSTATVTITPTGDLPNDGPSDVLEGFENGVPAGYFGWGSTDSVRPALSTTDATRPGYPADNSVLTAVVAGEPTSSDWFGFSNDTASTDWSDADGFSFWFLGTGSGGQLGYELKNGNQLFDRTVLDDADGWRQVSVLFSELRLKGAPGDPARFDPSASTGFAFTLTGLGAGSFLFDDIALFDRVVTLEDFEGDVPIGSPTDPVGFFPWGSPSDQQVTLGVRALERGDVVDNHVLAGTYEIPAGGWGGFSDNLAASRDWSSFRGIRFWWYASQPSNPASPTAGEEIKVEIKDGGPDAEHSELWQATFRDNWGSSTSRWKLVELPFSSFTLGGYQPGTDETQNGVLDLTAAWGFAPTLPPGKSGAIGWAVDDVQLYGTTAVNADVVSASQDVYLVDAGDTATVTLALTTATGDPLAADATVEFTSGAGTAEAGTHFTPFGGSVTFPAGSESGATRSFEVQTLTTTGGDEARGIPIALESSTLLLPPEAPRVVINAHGLPYLDSSLSIGDRVDDLLSRMSLAEKAGQMTQAERLGLASPSQIATLGLGSVLSGGGSTPAANTPEGWADMIDAFQRQALSTRLQVPLLYGADAVHGHNNVLGATIFPHNINLGATRDPALAEDIAAATAVETRTTGVNWAFAPCLCVARDERWGRTYESFGEDPALVKSFAAGSIEGLQGSDPTDKSGPFKLLATAKHWAGDGGTTYDPAQLATGGYPIDQGVTHAPSLEQFEAIHVDPYLPAIAAGVGSIMPSYSAVDFGAGPVRMHENTQLNTDVLKGELGFSGFLISDWEGIDKLPGGTYAEKAVRSVNSGLDMAMAPYNFDDFITSVETAVGSGAISQSRVDDAVRRILTQKFELGLFENAMADRSQADAFGSDDHRAIARRAVAQSQVLLKNANEVLPLAKSDSIYLAGSNADDLGNQMGGWSITWQGGSGPTTTGTTIADGIAEVAPNATLTVSPDASAPLEGNDVGVVVVGETPYAEGIGDVGNNGHSLSLSTADQSAIDTVCAAMECVVLIVAGRTQLVTDRIDAIDGLVASFLPGSEGQGVADVLFGDEPFTGRLPLTWPATAEQVPINVGDATYEPLYSFGWSERTDVPRTRLESVLDGLAAGAARDAVQGLLDAEVWGDGGQIGDPERAFPLIARAAALVTGADADLLVSLARDLAQAAITNDSAVAGSMSLTADAEHALLTGQAFTAVELLARVLGFTVGENPGGPGTPGNPGEPGGDGEKNIVSATVTPNRAKVGDRVTVSASGFEPGEKVSGTLRSDPVAIGTATASASGAVRLVFRVARGTDLGAHTVSLEGAEQIANGTLTVIRATAASTSRRPLASTGADIWLAVMVG
ncbi:MAG: hypothetical protein JWM51_1451, partial [Microbacteriaceae bacterium]|nr:hypothetical protein [Microbacteriaceae bacterium]